MFIIGAILGRSGYGNRDVHNGKIQTAEIKSWKAMYLLVKGCHPYQYRHRTRMKYVTSLSCKDVIERLGKEAKNDFQFKKANRNIEEGSKSVQ